MAGGGGVCGAEGGVVVVQTLLYDMNVSPHTPTIMQ